jgi:5-formyltetrahydrofolate cyclo-ligase
MSGAGKAELRTAVLARRERRDAAERQATGDQLARHGLAAWSGQGCLAAFLSVGTEPPTRPLVSLLRGAGVQVLVPAVDGAELRWTVIDDDTRFTRGALGVEQPLGPWRGQAALTTAAVVVVPALAVDRSGNRLGRGRGYYDRALRGLDVPVVAVVYDDEVLDHVPTQPHDRPVTGALTPSGLLALGNAAR